MYQTFILLLKPQETFTFNCLCSRVKSSSYDISGCLILPPIWGKMGQILIF